MILRSLRLFSTKTAAAAVTTTNVANKVQYNNSEIDVVRRRLMYHASKRGMLENELILTSFARKNLPRMDESELGQFKQLLDQYDDDLNRWIMNREPVPKEFDNKVCDATKRTRPLQIGSLSRVAEL